MQTLLLEHRRGLGDVVLMTALVRDIALTYPGRFNIDVDTGWSRVWTNNPYIRSCDPESKVTTDIVKLSWRDASMTKSHVTENGQLARRHILGWYHNCFERLTGIQVSPSKPYADIHLTATEKLPIVSGRYWVIISGGKLDMPVKHWHFPRVQQTVDALLERGIHCVQVGATHKDHIHPNLKNVLNLIGKTEDIRDLCSLIYNSDGVICGMTGAMHLAAAFQKPCVVFAGGREDPWFESYTNEYAAFGNSCEPVTVPHRFLHSVGKLHCCSEGGCWKDRVVPIRPVDFGSRANQLCVSTVRHTTLDDSQVIPACQDLIQVSDVVEAALSYYSDGTLPAVESLPAPTLIRKPAAVRVQAEIQTVYPKELVRPAAAIDRRLSIMDHPTIGGRMTVCVLCYGEYTELAKKCLGSLLNTVPIHRLDIRVATNQAAPETVDYLSKLPLRKMYVHPDNDYKYPVMREMFYDRDCPITTKYLLWLDDDTFAVNPNWMYDLCQTIIMYHDQGYRMYGDIRYHDLSRFGAAGSDWFKSASWCSGLPLRGKSKGEEVPNGSVIDFAVGWCWALEVETLRRADIPDIRLAHNGGDITIGEQLHQAGGGLMQWNRNKSQIACPAREAGGRRGFSQKFPWDK
jgi:ADP-heptose:LPS heptosyltransferase/GT2 family glycosyltransferase